MGSSTLVVPGHQKKLVSKLVLIFRIRACKDQSQPSPHCFFVFYLHTGIVMPSALLLFFHLTVLVASVGLPGTCPETGVLIPDSL